MTSNDRNNGTHRSTGRILGVGALACVVCCIGPILGLLGAIGIATIAGVLAFGIAGLTIALLAIPVVHRRRSARTCATGPDHQQPMPMPTVRQPS